eukprot:888115-Pyramimonas_sp.AAC.1
MMTPLAALRIGPLAKPTKQMVLETGPRVLQMSAATDPRSSAKAEICLRRAMGRIPRKWRRGSRAMAKSTPEP